MATGSIANVGEINKYDFRTETKAVFKARKGIDREIVEQISDIKDEPDWMRKFRLESLEIFESKPMPTWARARRWTTSRRSQRPPGFR